MLRRILSGLATFTLLGAGLALLPSTPASSGQAAAITVDTTVDDDALSACTDGADDDCSLRGALEVFADTQDPVDITVPAGTYALPDEIRMFQGNVNVHGAGVGETIVTTDLTQEFMLVRHLELRPHDGDVNVILSDMTFSDGLQEAGGGSIRAEGGVHLTLQRMHFVDNEALDSNGGAIAFRGFPENNTLEIEDSTFADNTAGVVGGAIHLDDETAMITNTTFTGNVAGFAGGALFVGNEDGPPTEATLTHVTMADNGVAVQMAPRAAQEEQSRGGAIGVGGNGTVTLEGTVIERSVEVEAFAPVAVGDPVPNCAVLYEGGDIISEGHNVVDDDSCDLDEDTDQPETAADTQDLDDNGGPTFTMALLADSPAVDTAGATCEVDADQRGVARPQDGNADDTVACDSGAYERPADPEEPPAAQPAQETPDFTG